MREENSFHHPITHQPKTLGKFGIVVPLTLWCLVSSHLVVKNLHLSSVQTPLPFHHTDCLIGDSPTGFWSSVIYLVVYLITTQCNPCIFRSQQGFFFHCSSEIFPIQDTSLNPFWRRKFPKISAAFGAAFGWPLAAPVTFSRIKSFTDQAVKRNELQVLWGQEKKVNAANTCYCTVYATNTWHFATFGNFTTDFAPTAMGFFCPQTRHGNFLVTPWGWWMDSLPHPLLVFCKFKGDHIYIHIIYIHIIYKYNTQYNIHVYI